MTLSTAAAEAATRYASPTGVTSPTCPQAAPCSLQVAAESASPNDEVIVGPGTYVETDPITPIANGLNIHGAPGASMPAIQSSAGNGVILNGTDQRIADLRIEHTNTGYGLLIYNDALAERMVVETTNGEAACSPFLGSVLRDSVCIATSPSGRAVGVSATDLETTGVVRNVTAVATGGNGAAIAISSGFVLGPSANVTLDVRNTIALGPPTGADVVLSATGGATADVELGFSNYDTVSPPTSTATTTFDPVGSPTNQTAVPQLTPAFRQLATSPTRNAGSVDGFSGTLDADGAQRVQGAAIDIGAYEFTEAAVSPPPGDTTAPQTTISKGPKKKTRKKKARFTFNADEAGSGFACKLDAAPFTSCSSPQGYKRLKKGKHTFSVVATDAAGNADASAATYRWKVKKRKGKG